MQLVFVVVLVGLAVVAGGCGGDGGRRQEEGGQPRARGLAFSAGYEPDTLRAGEPVTWRLSVRNNTPEAVTLTFPSGKKGDVVLMAEDGTEVYRWSEGMFFTEAIVRERLEPDEEVLYRLVERNLTVEPGTYDLVAVLAAEPDVGPDRQRVQIR